MSNIQATSSFSFHDNNIRVQGTPDEPLFCLADVCKTLDLTSPNKVVAQIKEEFNIRGELNSGLIKDANNHTQTATFITEPQLYFVMMRSRAIGWDICLQDLLLLHLSCNLYDIFFLINIIANNSVNKTW